MADPAGADEESAVLVTARSALVEPPATGVASVVELFVVLESLGADTDAVLVMTVPGAVPAVTCTTNVNVLVPGAMSSLWQVTVPVAPTAGVVHVQPAGAVIDWKVVLAGSVSVSVTSAS